MALFLTICFQFPCKKHSQSTHTRSIWLSFNVVSKTTTISGCATTCQFAPDAHVRVFREDGRTEFNADIPSSPTTSHAEQRSLMSRLSDPPSDHRKRRRDLFGSPSEYLNSSKRRATPVKVIHKKELPKRKMAMDFTDYMAGRELPTFDDILGDDDEEEHGQQPTILRSLDVDENSNSSSDDLSALQALPKHDQKDTIATRDPITTATSSSSPAPPNSASTSSITTAITNARSPLTERQEDLIHTSTSSSAHAAKSSFVSISPIANASFSPSPSSSSSVNNQKHISRHDQSSASDNNTSHNLSMYSEKDILDETPIRYDTPVHKEGIEKSPAVPKTPQSLYEWSRRIRQSFGIQHTARQSTCLREFLNKVDIPWKEIGKMKEMETTQLDHSLTRDVPTHEKAATVASFQELEAYKNYTSSLQELIKDNHLNPASELSIQHTTPYNMSAVFGVSELARTTVSSTSAAEATKRALALYRSFQKSVPEIQKLYELDLPESALRAKIREEFEKYRHVTDLQVRDVLLAKGQMEYQETMNLWKQQTHVYRYFAEEEAAPKPVTFLDKFFDGRSPKTILSPQQRLSPSTHITQ